MQPELFQAPAAPVKRGARLPADWKPSPDARGYAQARGLDPDAEAEAFRDYWLSKATKNTSLDWLASWRTWCRNALRFNPQQRNRYESFATKITAIPVQSEWGARLRGYRPGGFWMRSIWGPAPGESGCFVPLPELEVWKEELTRTQTK